METRKVPELWLVRGYEVLLERNFGNKGCFLLSSGIALASFLWAVSVSLTYDRHFAQRLLIHFASPSFLLHHSVLIENTVPQKMSICEKAPAPEK